MQKVLTRQEVKQEHTWDLEAIYPTVEAWEKDYAVVKNGLSTLAAFQGKLGESSETLLQFIRLRDDLGVKLEQLYVYAHMKQDEDTTVSLFQGLNDRAASLYAQFSAAIAFTRPEILSLSEQTVKKWLEENPGLSLYRQYLEDMLREKAHVRSTEVEELLAQSSEVARGPREIFGMLNNADMKWPSIKDENGNEVELTHGRYQRFRESKDRRVRKDNFQAFFTSYKGLRNTIAATYGTSVKKDVFYARARKFGTALEAALHANNIPLEVYHNLIGSVHKNLPHLERYMNLRKRLLGLDELHHYDLYVPMVAEVDADYPYEKSVETVLAACAPLGQEYVAAARKGFEQRWADVYETKGKRSGAYSSGAYTTYPYMLLNHHDNLESVYTLAHELGHSMHSYFTRKNQPYIYGDYSIFVAEVASTLNEALLTDYLLRQNQDPTFRMYLINRQMESFRTTLYRQTMFAEFELLAHQKVENGEPLTADSLTELYYGLVKKYYATVVPDEEIALEWSVIPHFYGAYYVFQYATGISAATALSQKILKEGAPAVERYLAFLGAGSSDYPINVLRKAGVDMASPEPVDLALQHFGKLVDEMENLAAARR